MSSKGIYVLHFCEKVKEFFGSLDETHLCDNKKFWGVVKPLLSNKAVYNERTTLVEDDKIIENDKNTAIFMHFSSNVITTLGVPQYNDTEPVSHNIGDPLMKAIMKYRFHPSIVAIKKNCNLGLSFSFSQVERHEIMKEINKLQINKVTQSTGTPTKLIKENSDIFGDFIFGNFNNRVSSSISPNSLKNTIITPLHKKGAKTSKDNYRPVIILSVTSKIYERLLFKQISGYFDPILSKLQCGFRKEFSAQHSLLAMFENWKSAVNNKENFGALLTDLSKAFDCLETALLNNF